MNTQVTQKLLATVRARFDAHPHRHPGLAWSDVRSVLTGSPGALPSLLAMESTGASTFTSVSLSSRRTFTLEQWRQRTDAKDIRLPDDQAPVGDEHLDILPLDKVVAHAGQLPQGAVQRVETRRTQADAQPAGLLLRVHHERARIGQLQAQRRCGRYQAVGGFALHRQPGVVGLGVQHQAGAPQVRGEV